MSDITPLKRWLGVTGGTTGELPSDILEEARRRLRGACVIYATAFSLAYGIPRLLSLKREGWAYPFSLTDAVSLGSIGLALTLAVVLWRTRRWSTSRLLDLGLVFEAVGALGIATSELWHTFRPLPISLDNVRIIGGISWVGVWMVAFPNLVPATRLKTSLAALASAASGPIVLLASYSYFDPGTPRLLQDLLIAVTVSNLICAGLAVVSSGVLHKLGRKVGEARRMGSYHLVEVLGEGGMGEVWKAEHRHLARPAAIKLVRSEALSTGNAAATERVLRRFEREAQATAQLRCPHSINLYDFGIADDGSFYYVMELLEGLSLETLVDRFGPVPAERAVYLLRQVCESLEEAHHRGLIHRDIKPANIFCCRYGLALDFVKVLDFGMVKTFLDYGSDATQLTADGALAGTPAYMAPELALAEDEVDPRVDIYALGCVAYWLLTGHLVFDAKSPMRIVMMHLEAEPVPPSSRTELDIPPELETLVLDCLEKRPKDRPGSVAEVIERLDACPLEAAWTQERARSWWTLNVPERKAPATAVNPLEPTL